MKTTSQKKAPKNAGKSSCRLLPTSTVTQVGEFYFNQQGKILTEDEVDLLLARPVNDGKVLPNFLE